MAIVHDYFFNRGVPGSAITIPSAGEPVYYIVFLLRNFIPYFYVCQQIFIYFLGLVNVNTQRSPNLSKNAFLHFAQMHPLVFVCFDTLLSLCSKKSH